MARTFLFLQVFDTHAFLPTKTKSQNFNCYSCNGEEARAGLIFKVSLFYQVPWCVELSRYCLYPSHLMSEFSGVD